MNLQKLLNDLLTIKSHAESLGMKSQEIAELRIGEVSGVFKGLNYPNLEFELAEDASGKKFILHKNLKPKGVI